VVEGAGTASASHTRRLLPDSELLVSKIMVKGVSSSMPVRKESWEEAMNEG